MRPKLYPVNLTAGGGDATPAHARASLLAAAETEIDGLRPWREGSPASRIHWPALARGAGLMERKLISEADSRPIVVLDPRAPSSPEALDAAVRAAGSLAVHFAKRTGCSLLLPGDRRATVIEPDLLASRPSTCAWRCWTTRPARRSSAAQNRRGLVVYVAARPVDRAPRGLGRTPGGCLIVVPSALPNRRAVLEVAGCRAYVLRAPERRGGRGGAGGRGLSGPPGRGRPGPQRAARWAPRAARQIRDDLLFSLPIGARAGASSRWPPGARCTGCRCCSRRSPARGWAVVGVGLLAIARAAGRRAPERAPARTSPRCSFLIPLTALALAGRRRPSGAAAARSLGRAVRRHLARHRRPAGHPRALPGARPWVRTVIPLGGSALVLLAAALAFWPRKDRPRAARSPRSSC